MGRARFGASKKPPISQSGRNSSVLANARLDFVETLQLDRALRRRFAAPPQGLETRPVHLAVLGSSTLEHLLPGLRVGALRHGLWIDAHTVDYGQYLQPVMDAGSSLHRFKPDVILFAFDAPHFLDGKIAATDANAAATTVAYVMDRLRALWGHARESLGCEIIQQTFLPVALPLLGNNEHRAPNSPLRLIRALNEQLRAATPGAGVDLLAIDERVAVDGLAAWHDPALWHRAKQEISPAAALLTVIWSARMLAARQGRSRKCLVLDLDNTLWGGVIGDDGLEGIKLGQGSALGEAHLAFQRYAHDLSRRGVILAVCSKNNEADRARAFRATSRDGAAAARTSPASSPTGPIRRPTCARSRGRLNIGLDSLVFARRQPGRARSRAARTAHGRRPGTAGGADALSATPRARPAISRRSALTAEDAARAGQYQANAARESAAAPRATDMDGYLRDMDMGLHWSPSIASACRASSSSSTRRTSSI